MISRRRFLKAIIAGALAFRIKNVLACQKPVRILSIYNIHTCESLYVQYYSSGEYDPQAIERINYLLRCHYTNEIKTLDINVINLLCDIKDSIDKNGQIQIISGYRSLAYNEFLRKQGRKVSKNSLHIRGLAIDFSIEGVSNNELSHIARSFSAGGVGKYRNFVHIDVGRLRYWEAG
jgi:uncharacterized protein YcbK (DUF882 family)